MLDEIQSLSYIFYPLFLHPNREEKGIYIGETKAENGGKMGGNWVSFSNSKFEYPLRVG